MANEKDYVEQLLAMKDAEINRLKGTIRAIRETALRNNISDRTCCEKVASMCVAALQ
jgi:hypothetical protein